jgi:hypothetical protein
MENKDEWKKHLYPAVLIGEASGRERNPCLFCNEGFKEGDKIISLFSSSYKNNTSYTNRFCHRCFLKVLLLNFPTLITDGDNLYKEINKDLILRKLGENS